jgi:hypothetical protein
VMNTTPMDNGFDPYHLRPLASLNRRQVIALAGIPNELVGKTGGELLSKPAFLELIKAYVYELGFENIDPAEYPQHLNAILNLPNAPAYETALTVAKQYGLRLGCFLASMVSSPIGLTMPFDPWEEGYLAYWKKNIRVVTIGGGLANGKLGEITCQVAESRLIQCGIKDRVIRAAANPSYLPLIGAARRIPGDPQAAVVADFGSSRAKRGLALYDAEHRLSKIILFPTVDLSSLTKGGNINDLAFSMSHILCDTIQRSHSFTNDLSPQLLCSVAAYVENGQPLNIDRGAYTSLNKISADIKAWFSEQIRQICAKEVNLAFEHDGDAAACALTGCPQAGLVMLGTGMGIGFVPPDQDLCQVAEQFCVITEP